jgi:6-phosphogluconolactonase
MDQEGAKNEIVRLADADALARTAAERIVADSKDAIALRGQFTIALAGGSTPKKAYGLLASAPFASEIEWSRVYAFFGDERFVPKDDDNSNYKMANESLLSKVPIPTSNVFPVPTDKATPGDAAKAYEATLRAFFDDDTNPPRFDLILLGLGDDGHTASLFPNASSLGMQDFWVVWSPPGVLPPPVDRITFTNAVLNAARHVLFLVAGANKAEALADVLEHDASALKRPAAGVRPTNGTLTWLVDQEAAKLLKS